MVLSHIQTESDCGPPTHGMRVSAAFNIVLPVRPVISRAVCCLDSRDQEQFHPLTSDCEENGLKAVRCPGATSSISLRKPYHHTTNKHEATDTDSSAARHWCTVPPPAQHDCPSACSFKSSATGRMTVMAQRSACRKVPLRNGVLLIFPMSLRLAKNMC